MELTIDGVTYVTCDLLGYSDYSNGGSVCRANVRHVLSMFQSKVPQLPYRICSDIEYAQKHDRPDFIDEATRQVWRHKPELILLYGGHGTTQVLIRKDVDEEEGITAALADYPVLDDQDLSDVEREMEDDAWESWIECDLKDQMIVVSGSNSWVNDDAFDWIYYDLKSDDMRDAYYKACDKTGEYGFVDGDTWWIDVTKVAPTMTAMLWHQINA